ncbi:MAG: hypothetical protein BCS36_05700 [Desulfovibrio sp. MES5]|nr:MAG: hypothetical protein BCS36_05700 [Desulfovibrio sp. MES5]
MPVAMATPPRKMGQAANNASSDNSASRYSCGFCASRASRASKGANRASQFSKRPQAPHGCARRNAHERRTATGTAPYPARMLARGKSVPARPRADSLRR